MWNIHDKANARRVQRDSPSALQAASHAANNEHTPLLNTVIDCLPSKDFLPRKALNMTRITATLFLLSAFLLSFAARTAWADTLTITSTPAGANVEIDGVKVGTTPYEMKLPGGYFHKTAFGAHLEHAMRLRVSKDGFAAKEIEMTEGPIHYVAYNVLGGAYRGDCWLMKTNHFDFVLEPATKSFTGIVVATSAGNAKVEMRPELAVEDIVQQSKPAVVLLRRPDGHGSGFFITETGVIVTNAHVAEGQQTLVAELSTGQKLDANVVYIDSEKDIALVKVGGSGFQHLPLANLSTVQQGQTVVALGNPGLGMSSSATKGIVSAVGEREGNGKGTWIQTDAAINPGNSGGPLLNTHAEVVGVNTIKIVSKDVQGIGFALSSNDLLEALQRFYPVVSHPGASPNQLSDAFGIVAITSDPDGAEVYLDGKFVGNSPATLKIPVGEHTVRLTSPNRVDWERAVEILKDSQVNLRAQLATAH
jgi:serine protease Do